MNTNVQAVTKEENQPEPTTQIISTKNVTKSPNEIKTDSGYSSDFKPTKKILEYGSDSSSDTGVCSLSSTEGDYSLSTLV